MSRRHLVLVGLMGAGKTSIGERCALRLGRPFVDTDALVEAVAGATVAEIFAAEGEVGFRARERTAVADATASPVPTVIACGGGAVLDPENRQALRGAGVVIWLRAAPDVLARRVGSGVDRPLLVGDPQVVLARLATLRADAYEAVADVAVDTDDTSLDDVVGVVLSELTKLEPA